MTNTVCAEISNATSPWYTLGAKKQVTLQVEVFTSSACSHCKKLETYLKSIQAVNPWLNIRTHVINENKAALETYALFLKQQKVEDFVVPSIFFCNTRWVGFENTEKSGTLLLDNFNRCRDEIQKNGKLLPQTTQGLKQVASASWYQENFNLKMPDWALIPVMAVIDALTPETSFIILSLLCFMIIEKKKRLQIASMLLFLLGVAFAHYFYRTYTDLFYHLVSILRVPTALIGLGLLTYLFAFHPKVFSKQRSLPVVISLIWLVLTGLFVQIYQQMHVPNFSLIFQQWLIAQQDISANRYLLYSLFYQLIYLLVIGLSTLLVFTVLRYYGRWTKHQMVVDEFAWQYLTLIGFILLLYPYTLASAWYATLGFILVLVSSWISYIMWSKKRSESLK